MKKAFISYSYPDFKIARDVYDALKIMGFEVWLDIYELDGYPRRPKSIENA